VWLQKDSIPLPDVFDFEETDPLFPNEIILFVFRLEVGTVVVLPSAN
jgi:hypothetical protein